MLTFDKVKDIVQSELDPRIKNAREMSSKLRLHVNGEGLQAALAKINNYENQLQYEAREKHAISNKFLTEELLRPVDNAFHARGGSKNYVFTTDSKNKENELVEKLVNVRNNSSLTEYIEQEWFNRYITDPNGLIFMEINSLDEMGEELPEDEWTIEPCYKSIFSIRAYEQNGIFVHWVIFEPHEITVDENDPNEDKHAKIFWAVDEESYYLYEYGKEGLKLLEKKENDFDKVPAVLCSNIIDNTTGWKKSAIDSQVELLDKYMVSNSVLNIAEFFHNYLQQWTYIDKCNKCHGSGNVNNQGREEECSDCKGTGKSTKKDVTDIIELKIPDTDGTKIDPPSGYIFAPTEGWEGMIASVKRTWDTIYFSQWGTVVSREAKNETATGRFLDAQPVNNRLNKYSISIENTHQEIANFIGKFYFSETFERSIVQYGRRYLIETPDQIWDKYIQAKKDKAPVSTLDLLLSQFLESEFRENEQMFVFETKKTKLEPFVHWDIEIVQKLNVDKEDYYKKLYFSAWLNSILSDKGMTYIVDTPLNKLNEELTSFVSDKIPETELINKKDEILQQTLSKEES